MHGLALVINSRETSKMDTKQILNLIQTGEVQKAVKEVINFNLSTTIDILEKDGNNIAAFFKASAKRVMEIAFNLPALISMELKKLNTKTLTDMIKTTNYAVFWASIEKKLFEVIEKLQEYAADLWLIFDMYSELGEEAMERAKKIQPFNYLANKKIRNDVIDKYFPDGVGLKTFLGNPFKPAKEAARAFNDKWELGLEF